MNQEKIGKFIAELRKKKKMTQEKLGNEIGVTDKTVSRWETGKYMPDISLFKPLSEILEVSINDLMSGEIVDENDYQEKFEENVINVVDKVEKKNKFSNLISNILLGIIALFSLWLISYAFYSNVEFKQNYKEDKMIVIKETKNNDLMFQSKESGRLKYIILNSKMNNEEIGLIFVTYYITLENIYNDSRELNDNHIDLTSDNYVGTEIMISNSKVKDNYKVYYTTTSFSKIANADERELNEIINKSVLMFETN